MPLFFLMGGEVVIAIVGSRIALWLFRGIRAWRAAQEAPPEPPPEREALRPVAEVRVLAAAKPAASQPPDAIAA